MCVRVRMYVCLFAFIAYFGEGLKNMSEKINNKCSF